MRPAHQGIKKLNHYETHLTLAPYDSETLALVSKWAIESKMKWTQILLDAGKTPLQPMITFWGSESMAEQHRLAESFAREISQMGGSVVRVKIEAYIENDEVPHTDSEAQKESTRYFEHHVKLLLSASADLNALSQRVAECEARLSQNLRRRRPDGRSERFITQRVYSRGRVHAKARLDRLLKHLSDTEFHVAEIEEEYVVFDSNIAVDSGWMEPMKGYAHDAVRFVE